MILIKLSGYFSLKKSLKRSDMYTNNAQSLKKRKKKKSKNLHT